MVVITYHGIYDIYDIYDMDDDLTKTSSIFSCSRFMFIAWM